MISLYYVENKINGRMYIGQTHMTIEKRWYFHKSNNSHCIILNNAIKKYGADNFEINIFQYCETQEEADQVEIYWITELKIICKLYNIKEGGSSGKHSKKTCTKISKSLIGNKRAKGMSPNQTSFIKGNQAPNKGRKRIIDEFGKMRFIKPGNL